MKWGKITELTRINLYFVYIVNNIEHLIIRFLYLDTYKLEKTKTLFNLYFCSIYLFVLFTRFQTRPTVQPSPGFVNPGYSLQTFQCQKLVCDWVQHWFCISVSGVDGKEHTFWHARVRLLPDIFFSLFKSHIASGKAFVFNKNEGNNPKVEKKVLGIGLG